MVVGNQVAKGERERGIYIQVEGHKALSSPQEDGAMKRPLPGVGWAAPGRAAVPADTGRGRSAPPSP